MPPRIRVQVGLGAFAEDLREIEKRAQSFMRQPPMVEETRRFFRRRMLQTWVEKKDPETDRPWGVGKTKVIDLIDTGDLRRSMLNPAAVRPVAGRNALWFSPDAPPYAEHVQARYGFMPADRQMLDYLSPRAAQFVLSGKIR